MSTTSSVTTSSSTDAYGNSYTTAVSNDQLQNSDFINLMVTQLKNQDPTKATDSSQIMDTELKLANLNASNKTISAMEALQTSYQQSALSNSSALIGNIVENGNTDDSGNAKQYKVASVSMNNGTINLSAYQVSNYYDVYSFNETSSGSDIVSTTADSSITLKNSSGNSYTFSTYNKTYNDLATEISKTSGITATVNQNTNGNYQLVVSVSNGSSSLSQNDSKLTYSKDSATSYASTPETITMSSITKIY